MRNFGNNGLQVPPESTNNSNSGTSDESYNLDGSPSNHNINSAGGNNKKRAHSGHTKAHNMAPENNDNAGKRKNVSGITRPDLQRSVPTFLSKLYK
jgi:hypothetical protein